MIKTGNEKEGGSKQQEYIKAVQVGKEWCRDGELCKVFAGSGRCEDAVQIENWLSWVEDKKICKMVIDE